MPNIIAILKHRRESLGLSLLEIQDKIRINAKFIEAIEKGDFDALPNPLYIKIFLRSYAKFLGLDVPEIMALL